MQVIGVLNRVRELDGDGGREPLFSASIEGFSALCRPDVAARVGLSDLEGKLVSATVSVHWRKPGSDGRSRRPLHWLTDAAPVAVGLSL